MANVLNTETMERKMSVHTPYYKKGHADNKYGDNWLINPAVPDCDPKYWKMSKGKIAQMTATEKANVDAAQTKVATKESLIAQKQAAILREQAISELKTDGLLDASGDPV